MPRERFRRALRGYDPEEVDAAIDARDARLARLEREAQRLAERVVEREKKLQEALRKPVASAAEANRVVLTRALSSVEEIYAQARRQATRMRMKALEDAVQMADRVTELTNLRDELGARIAELAEVARIAPRDRGGGGTRDRSAGRVRRWDVRGHGRGGDRAAARLRAAHRLRGRGGGHPGRVRDLRQELLAGSGYGLDESRRPRRAAAGARGEGPVRLRGARHAQRRSDSSTSARTAASSKAARRRPGLH